MQKPARLLRRPEVEHLLGLGPTSVYKLVRLGRLPRPVRIADNAVGWPETEIAKFIEDRIRERDSA